MKTFFWRPLIILLLSVASGCGNSVQESSLYGTYKADYKFASETLVLSNNYEFTQEVCLKNSVKISKKEGGWHYEKKIQYIVFENNFMSVLDGFDAFVANYDCPQDSSIVSAVLPVRRFPSLRIEANDYIHYVKQ